MLTKPVVAAQEVIYPTIETPIYDASTGVTSYVVSACFHDLTSASDHDLAGMALAIVGNMTKGLGEKVFNPELFAELRLRRSRSDAGVKLPWPGLADDRPLPLDLTQLPWDTAMFIDEANQLKYRIDRLAFMDRVATVWVPWLRSKLVLA